MKYEVIFEIDKEIINLLPMISIDRNINSKGLLIGWLCFYCIIYKGKNNDNNICKT